LLLLLLLLFDAIRCVANQPYCRYFAPRRNGSTICQSASCGAHVKRACRIEEKPIKKPR
jgi:hypothetical protein